MRTLLLIALLILSACPAREEPTCVRGCWNVKVERCMVVETAGGFKRGDFLPSECCPDQSPICLED